MVLHLEKKAIRALGIAESFNQEDALSTLAGVVMRSDLVIDGVALGKMQVSGFDSTSSILKLYHKLARNDINAILLGGSILSLYNIVDVDQIFKEIHLPVIALSFKKSKSDISRNILERFPAKIAERKIKQLQKLGEPREVLLSTGYRVHIRAAGVSDLQAKRLLDRFTLQGAVPEPVRVSRLFAKVALAARRAE